MDATVIMGLQNGCKGATVCIGTVDRIATPNVDILVDKDKQLIVFCVFSPRLGRGSQSET